MLTNYFKIAWRNLQRNKIFSAINITGLAMGIACSLLILLWVQDERSVDAFHKNGKQLYQIYERQYYDGKVEASYPTQGLLAEELRRIIPGVQYACATDYASAPGSLSTFEAGSKVSKLGGYFAGRDFFSMFSYQLLQGTVANAISSPGSIAISRKMAGIFYGSPEQAIGQIIRVDNKDELKVTAVFEDLPANSSQQFDFLRSWDDFIKENKWVNNWGNTSPNSYIQLSKGVDPHVVEKRIKDFIYRYQPADKGTRMELALQPYPEKYLHSVFKNGRLEGGRIGYVTLFTIVAIFILLIACINFMNLSTARAARRAKEVGLRKVIGALRSSLIIQFIGEAMLLTFISVVFALALTQLLLPAFNGLTGKQLSLPVMQPPFWLALAGLLVVTGLVAGSYPALFLSSLKPVRVLKGTLKFSWGSTFFRQGLVVFQFTLSIILIIGMIVIYRQMDYIKTRNLGYDRENLIYIPIEGELIKKYGLFKSEAAALPGILSISKMRNSPTIIEHHTGSISWPGKDPNLTVSFADGVVGYDFVKTMKLQLKAGRDFASDFGGDTTSFIVNETAANRLGYKEPVGQTIVWGNHPGKIIGVLSDFHFSSMHQAIDPLIIRLDEQWPWGTVLVRVSGPQTREAIAGLERLSKTINPKFPFTYQFSDLEFARLYKSEAIVSKLSNYFAFLAIFISCLGLFGLATFTAAQRTKEIGVRKVLGASVPRIVAMLSNNFLKLVGLASLIAFPIAWLVMDQWLKDFMYRISIRWWMFALAAGITLVIALFTVSYQSIRAATRNPVKSLRSD